jgi:WhiB family redox-sensing transcriptional regulator
MDQKRTFEWQEKAACHGMGPDMFFPSEPQGKDFFKKAREICEECSVRLECLDYALDYPWMEDMTGMYGGKSPWQREQIRRQRAKQNIGTKYSYSFVTDLRRK